MLTVGKESIPLSVFFFTVKMGHYKKGTFVVLCRKRAFFLSSQVKIEVVIIALTENE